MEGQNPAPHQDANANTKNLQKMECKRPLDKIVYWSETSELYQMRASKSKNTICLSIFAFSPFQKFRHFRKQKYQERQTSENPRTFENWKMRSNPDTSWGGAGFCLSTVTRYGLACDKLDMWADAVVDSARQYTQEDMCDRDVMPASRQDEEWS